MNQVKAYKVLQESGFSKDNAELFIQAMNENENASTKTDLKDLKNELKQDIKDLEIKILHSINSQTNKFIVGITIVGTVFKLADLLIHKLGG